MANAQAISRNMCDQVREQASRTCLYLRDSHLTMRLRSAPASRNASASVYTMSSLQKSNGKEHAHKQRKTWEARPPSSSADMSGKDGEAPDLISSWTRSRSRAQCAGEPRRLGLRFSPP